MDNDATLKNAADPRLARQAAALARLPHLDFRRLAEPDRA
jgi:hypothetical protein